MPKKRQIRRTGQSQCSVILTVFLLLGPRFSRGSLTSQNRLAALSNLGDFDYDMF